MKWFSREKGWGFIRLESGEDVFVHHSDIEGEGFVTLEDDQPVEFVVEEMEKGPRARDVREVGAEAPAQKSDPAAGEHPRREGREGGDPSGERMEPTERAARGGERRPLTEQLFERLGRRFPGLGG